jgi:nucleotide-binding universal stress UspA family protein
LSRSAERLLRKSPCSVLLVDGIQPQSYERILVPIDVSSHSHNALDVACAIARSHPGAALVLQHVYHVRPEQWVKIQSYSEFLADARSQVEKRLMEHLDGFDFGGVAWSLRCDRNDDVATTILDAANEIDAGLLVLASHGLTHGAGILLGHVADTVFSRTDRTALAVKRKGEVIDILQALLQMLQN